MTVEPSPGWSEFLADRGIDASAAEPTPLVGGEVNANWKVVDDNGDRWVLRQYRQTRDPAELDCELAAVEHLAASGFPTPAPQPDRTGRRWDWLDGHPAAVFTFADGMRPPQRDGGYGSLDVDLGRRAARLAGRLHRSLDGTELPGGRDAGRDPWRRIGDFLAGPSADAPVFAGLVDPVRTLHDHLRRVYHEPADDLPRGLIHDDLTPSNVLVDQSGEIVAVVDFDDSVQTLLAYELGSIVATFGKDHDRRIDPERVALIVAAYHEVRPLTAAECTLLPDLLAAHAAAQGLSVLTNWLARGQAVEDPLLSYSVQEFLDLVDDRHQVRQALTAALPPR